MSLRIRAQQSLTPRRSTLWFPRGIPALAMSRSAGSDSGVNSFGTLKCVLTKTGWYLLSISTRAGVMRCGMVTGTRVPMRMTSTDGASLRRRLQDVLDPIIGKKKRISPRKQDVADFGFRLQIRDAGIERIVPDRRGALPDLPFPGAVPAQHRALVHDDPQHSIGITVGHSRRHRITVFVEGVLDVEVRETEFAFAGHRLQTDRAIGIFRIDERRIVRRYGESEPLESPLDGSLFARCDVDDAREIFG